VARSPHTPKRKTPVRAAPVRHEQQDNVEPSGRYTPPTQTRYRIRPDWHKGVGVASIVFGIGLFIVCQLNIVRPRPGDRGEQPVVVRGVRSDPGPAETLINPRRGARPPGG
jgi:hypothetical protein